MEDLDNSILKQIDVISCLEVIKKEFALALTDKASNKVVIICKRYYVDVILNKRDVIGHENNTYSKANKRCDGITAENTEYTKRLCFKITKTEKRITIKYCIPKVHKNPISARLMNGSKIRFIKQTLKSVSNVFVLQYSQIEHFNKEHQIFINL